MSELVLRLFGSDHIDDSRHRTVAQKTLNNGVILQLSAEIDMQQVSPSCSLFFPRGVTA